MSGGVTVLQTPTSISPRLFVPSLILASSAASSQSERGLSVCLTILKAVNSHRAFLLASGRTINHKSSWFLDKYHTSKLRNVMLKVEKIMTLQNATNTDAPGWGRKLSGNISLWTPLDNTFQQTQGIFSVSNWFSTLTTTVFLGVWPVFDVCIISADSPPIPACLCMHV